MSEKPKHYNAELWKCPVCERSRRWGNHKRCSEIARLQHEAANKRRERLAKYHARRRHEAFENVIAFLKSIHE